VPYVEIRGSVSIDDPVKVEVEGTPKVEIDGTPTVEVVP
jgi:hypothetical protein